MEKDSWGYFYNLFCNSTYCLLDVAGENMQKKIMFHDIGNYGFDVSNHRGIYLRILNHGIYDKKGTDTFRFRFWVDKWDITEDAEKERIWNESEKNFERNVERIRNRK